MSRTDIKATLAIALLMLWPKVVHAQDISQIAKSDPLIITGAVGTQNTYYYSSVGDGYASPMNNMVYANLNISLYGISMPFSFYYTNDNTSFNYPHISFHISPRYKNWSLHFGQSSMNYSSYVMSMPFNGYGVEYQGDKLRFGVFTGTLRKAVNDDPTNPAARSPQYKRTGWGIKLGYGSRGNYLDIYFLRAYDRLKSLDERWANTVSPQDNMVVGLRGGVSYSDHLSLTANLAVSLLSLDKKGTIVTNDEAERFDKIFDGDADQEEDYDTRKGNGKGEGEGNGGGTPPQQQPEQHKYYVEGKEAKIVHEMVQIIGEDGRTLRTEKLTDYTRRAIKNMYPTLDAFRGAWAQADKKQAIIDEMKEHDVLLDAVIEEMPQMKDYDYFDIIIHLAYDQIPLTRKDRAKRVRDSSYLDKYSESARKIIEGLMDKFGEVGVTEIENPLILKLDPFASIAKRPIILTKFFKGQGDYNKAVRDLEEELYKVG